MSQSPSDQALLEAVQDGNAEAARQALAEGAAPDSRNPKGWTVLMLAASNGDTELVRVLLEARADVEATVSPEAESAGPRLWISPSPAGGDLGELLRQATENADEATQQFASVMQSLLGMASETHSGEAPGSGDQAVEEAEEDVDEVEAEEDVEEEDVEEDEVDDAEETHSEQPIRALEIAIDRGHTEVARLLLDAGALANAPSWDQTPPLVFAAARGRLELARLLLDRGAKVNAGFDEPPLFAAIRGGHPDMIRLLAEAGAKVNMRIEDELTPLMAAASTGKAETVQILIELGADVNAWGQGETPLLCAARAEDPSAYELLYPLVEEDIRRRGPEERARSAQERARRSDTRTEKLIDAAMMGELQEVQASIAAGVDVDTLGSNGNTALMYAATYGHMAVLEALLEAGANPEVRAEESGLQAGGTALMMAAGSFFASNREQVVRRLAEAGADLNARDPEGRTALCHAITSGSGYTGSVRTLIELGADLGVRDEDGSTALMLAGAAKCQPIVDLLLQAGASRQDLDAVELIEAVEAGDAEKAREVLARGADVNRLLGTTPLCAAAGAGNAEMVRLLLESGANPERRRGKGSFNPLIDAAYSGHLEVVRLLVEAGADVHAEIEDMGTALDYARMAGSKSRGSGGQHREVIEYLQRQGARSKG